MKKTVLQIHSLLIIFIASSIFTTSCSNLKLSENRSNTCLENQAALDIGSGSSKILVAQMDTCAGKIKKIIWKDSKSLKIKESLVENQIPEEMAVQLNMTISKWKAKNKFLKIKIYKAVATEVFRQAQNGQAVISKLEIDQQIKINIIDQKQESILGFWSAVTQSGFEPNSIMSWDIGGGSMQMTTLDSNGKFIFYNGKMASVSFKNDFLRTTKCFNKPDCSPNPLGLNGALSAIKIAEIFAKKDVPVIIKKEIKNKKVIGIGGVHSKSILDQLLKFQSSEKNFNLNNLQSLIFNNAKLSDSDLGGEYAETQVTNIALVLGFMKKLEIPVVYPVGCDLTQGLLVSKDFQKN